MHLDRTSRIFAIVMAIVWAVAVAACRPPVDEPLPPDSSTLNPTVFVGDVPALGPDWYDYDGSTHVLTPKNETYLVRDDDGDGGVRHAAVRILSYYGEGGVTSGLFSFQRSVYDDATSTWSAPSTIELDRNVKSAAVCVDLFAVDAGVVDCNGAAWQLAFRTLARVIPEAGFAVSEPGLFPRSVDGIASAGTAYIATLADNIDALPDPRALAALDDATPTSWSDDPLFARDAFAKALPLAGQIVGRRFSEAQDDVVFIFTGHRTIARLSWHIDDDGDVSITGSAAAVDLSTMNVGALPAPSTVTITVNAQTPRALVRFDGDQVVVDDALLPATLADFGDELRYDLELLFLDDGTPSLRLSPAAALYNATAIDGVTELETAQPPTSSSDDA